MIGTKLAHYEITAHLGSGGMGEVYRAHDTKLGREVAIKILSATLATNPDRVARFEREAKVLAALNHPNIAAIYGLEDSGDLRALIMELVEGRSLAEAMSRGKAGLPLHRLLEIGIPVADAVAAAHQKGVTHRDIKPANIMLGEGENEGRVKVLDFGLAKLMETLPGAAAATSMPTAPITAEGHILGTVAYMSPEQAQGKTTDTRSDLFSLGVVLYEMAIGQRPFTGDTSISIISSIVKDTPKPVTELNTALPRELGRIIRRALAKDPERRYQTAKDLRNDLEELKASLDSGELQTQATGSGAAARSGGVHMWQAVTLGVGIVLMAAIAVLVVLARRQPESVTSQGAAPQPQMVRLTNTGNARLPALSADGKYVAYVQEDDDQQSVWVRQIASNSNVRIVEPARGTSILGLTVSPDGNFVDFVGQEAGQPPDLRRVPFLGGPTRKLVDDVWSAPGWSPDGRQMAFLTQNALATERSVVVAEADGSRPRAIATRTLPQRYITLSFSPRCYLPPLWLPDGRSVAVVVTDAALGFGNFQVVSVNVATGAETNLVLLENYGIIRGMGMALARDGRSFILGKGAAGAQQLVSVRPPDGATTNLTNDVAEYAGVSLAGDAVASARQETRWSLWLADAAGNGARQIGQEVPGGPEGGGLAWAAGAHVIREVAVGSGLSSIDLTTGVSQVIVPAARYPSTTADGRTLVFLRQDNQLWRAEADGTHATEIAGARGNWASLTPDGSAVLYASVQSGSESAWIVDPRGGSPRQFASVYASRPEVSPDGRFVMLSSRDERTRAPETLIVPIGGGEPVRRLTMYMGQDSFRPMHWTPDGQSLAYIDPKSQSNIMVQSVAGGAASQLTHFTDGRRISAFAWSHDGKQLALSRAIDSSDIVMLKGIR